MSHYRFQPIDIESSDDAWRPLDRAVARWCVAHGGSQQLARCAAQCSAAEAEGHTSVQLSAADAAAIIDEALVGPGERTSAFVLDASGRFQFWRNYDAERDAALAIAGRCSGDSGAELAPMADVEQLFDMQHPERTSKQRKAVRQAPAHRLFVLTGGPGTGKTTTIVRMLLQMLKQSGGNRSIRVAAPTGKAAQRLVQAMNRGLRDLRASLDSHWDAAFAAMPKPEALTLHRLLGYDPRRNRYTHDAEQPLSADIVVVDEASMMDLAQARSLFAAMKPSSTLILVGDPDQLTSVAAGAVLMDIVDTLTAHYSPQIVGLTQVFRAEQHLVPVNEAVRIGDPVAFAAAMGADPDTLTWRVIDTRPELDRVLREWSRSLVNLLHTAGSARQHSPDSARGVLSAVAGIQLLCALRETPFGALAAHRTLEAMVRRGLQVDGDATWFPGRLVMVTRNDYANQLFNGDVGIALHDEAGELLVWFEAVDDDGEVSARGFAPNTLPDHEGAYAITIHKSQGSEYRQVALLLPPDADHRVLSRQLLYTGVSRARRCLSIWGTKAVVDAALMRPVERQGGFAQRLRMDLLRHAPTGLPSV
ncbi:MAG: exodeoxyribonuclease V subunit alpha [Rhodanobacteraceae bacterium]|nr:exodeoxyribonuclease V subunit alpha [Rhodanobacteraceae bacterium]MBP9154936.1 exodeoxyribonuclease V subunit alpha [Xanthomonadales bacterium]